MGTMLGGRVMVDDDRPGTIAAAADRLRPALERLAVLLLADVATAQDVVADVTARVVRSEADVTDVDAYLRRAVLNEARSRLRQDAARRRREERWAVASHDARGDAVDGPAEASAQRAAVLQALQSLGERQRAVVVLRYFADLPEAEVADLLGIRVGTVKSQASRALTRLRPLLEGDDDR
jgi:RNA polymerase sigma factor (sigma-70 family)